MKDKEQMAISFAKWIDFNYYQGEEFNQYATDGTEEEVYTIEELFEMFKRLNN